MPHHRDLPRRGRRQFLKAAAAAALLPRPAGAAALPPLRARLGVTVEEISDDLAAALAFVKSFGLGWVEIRKIGGVYATEMSIADIKAARKLMDQHGVRLSVFDTPLYKCDLPGLVSGRKDEFPYAAQAGILERGLVRAEILGSRYLRVFAFWRAGDPKAAFDRAAEHLTKACALAKKAGMTLLLENLNGANVETSAEAARMLTAIPAKNFGLAWDPNNAYCGGDTPFPDGYRLLDWKRVHHVHLRDAAFDPDGKKCRWLPVGKGKVDNRGLLAALAKDRFPGTISLETHYQRPDKNKELASRESLQGLLALLAKS